MQKHIKLGSLIFCLFSFYVIILNRSESHKNEKEMSLKPYPHKEKYIKKIESLCNNAATTIIIGSGPAGQAAAMYCARLGGKPLVIAGQDGGALEYTGIVENIPYVVNKKGRDVVGLGIEQAKSFGAVFVNEIVTKIAVDEYPYKVITDKNVYYGFSVILAMGSHVKKLECPGAEEFWGKGISSCAVCDAPFYKNKKVIVVGGGDTACEEALQLSFYANEILVFVRKDAMRASKAMQEKLKNHSKIKVIYNTEITEIIGSQDHITKVVALSDGEKKEFSTDGIFIAIGQFPNTQLVEDFVEIEDKTRAVIYQGRTQQLSQPGFFGAGEVGDVFYKQAGVASGEGIKAAIDCFHFLSAENINEAFIRSYDKIWVTSLCQNGVCAVNKTENNTTSNSKEIAVAQKQKTIKAISYKKELKKTIDTHKGKYFLLDFTAPWCSGCKVLKKSLEEYVKKESSLPVFAINVDEMDSGTVSDISPQIQIKSIPLLLLMKGNKVVARHVGSMTVRELQNWVRQTIS
jgi:thioredoxin reductase (NADPH)